MTELKNKTKTFVNNFLVIKHRNTDYHINIKKLSKILRLLTKQNLNNLKHDAILKLMNEYKLLDEWFLKNINNI